MKKNPVLIGLTIALAVFCIAATVDMPAFRPLITSPSSGEVITYNGTRWVNGAGSGGGISGASLNTSQLFTNLDGKLSLTNNFNGTNANLFEITTLWGSLTQTNSAGATNFYNAAGDSLFVRRFNFNGTTYINETVASNTWSIGTGGSTVFDISQVAGSPASVSYFNHYVLGDFSVSGASTLSGAVTAGAGVTSTNADNYLGAFSFPQDATNQTFLQWPLSGAFAAGVKVTNTIVSLDGSPILQMVGTSDGTGLYTNLYAQLPRGVASQATNAPVNIPATGWTNTFNKNATVYFDGTAVTYTVKNNLGASVYTNTAAAANGTINLQPGGAVVLSGTGVVGVATPW